MKLLIKGAKIINPLGVSGIRDLLVEDGRIAAIEENIECPDAKVIDVSGMLVMPGLIDMHCHLREPGLEYKEDIQSGTRAAAAGGFTAVACMPNTKPVCDNEAVLRHILERARDRGSVKVWPIAAITKGQNGAELTEMGILKSEGAVAFSDDGKPVENARIMRMAMQYAKNFGALIISHCEDKALAGNGVMNEGKVSARLGLAGVSRAAEEMMVAREILLAQALQTKVHIAHVSTRGSVELVRNAKKMGTKVTCETCPHYFAATEELVGGYNTNAKVNPPLREEADRLAIIEGLLDGTIDAIATDHAPHHEDEKKCEFNMAASGLIGFETAYSLAETYLVRQAGMTYDQLVEKMSAAPARILGKEGGVLKVGGEADITIISPNADVLVDASKSYSKASNTPFDGMRLKGKVMYTVVSGKVVLENGKIAE